MAITSWDKLDIEHDGCPHEEERERKLYKRLYATIGAWCLQFTDSKYSQGNAAIIILW
jgi:hypothetical protein